MAKGFGIAGLAIAITAIFIPFFGLYVSVVAVILAAIAALAGDRIFATATTLIAFVNTMFLSPSTWLSLYTPTYRGFMTVMILIIGSLPFIAMALNAASKASRSRVTPPSTGGRAGPSLDWPTYSQKQAIAKLWSDYGTYIIVAAVIIPFFILKGPSWIEYGKQEWSERTGPTNSGTSNVPTIPVDIGPTTQMLLGTAGRVAGIRIVTADQVPKTIQPGGPTAVGNDVQNGMYYVCYLADVSTCEAAFKQEATLEGAVAGNGSTNAQLPTIEVPAEKTPTAPPQQNSWNNTEEPPPYQAPPTPQVEETHWGHNGSSLRLEASGASRRFYYIQPRIGLVEVGVAQGMVAFEGTQSGNVYAGTAYVFSKICGAIGYPVNGFVGPDERSITLSGIAPYVDAQCRRAGEHQAVLVFQQTD